MSTIDLDIESPLFADSHNTPAPAVPVTVSAEFDDDFEDIPLEMPKLEQTPPKREKAPAAKAAKPQAAPVMEEIPGKVSGKEARESAQQVALEIQQGSAAPPSVF